MKKRRLIRSTQIPSVIWTLQYLKAEKISLPGKIDVNGENDVAHENTKREATPMHGACDFEAIESIGHGRGTQSLHYL